MSDKKKTVKKAEAAPHTQASPEKLEAAKVDRKSTRLNSSHE